MNQDRVILACGTIFDACKTLSRSLRLRENVLMNCGTALEMDDKDATCRLDRGTIEHLNKIVGAQAFETLARQDTARLRHNAWGSCGGARAICVSKMM